MVAATLFLFAPYTPGLSRFTIIAIHGTLAPHRQRALGTELLHINMFESIAAPTTGLLPVILFLIGFVLLDSYKLVRLGPLLVAILSGCAIAGISYLVNIFLVNGWGLDFNLFTRYIAPIVEESLKALVVFYFLRANRVGFLVDAAIIGFAVGAGFAVVENIYYMTELPDATPIVWIVRGCGTAIMHGGATAIFAVISKALQERAAKPGARLFVPGLLIAVLLHSIYNHFFFQPVLSTLIVLISLPPLLFATFWYSERSLRRWLDVGFDSSTELIELIHSGEFSASKAGRYLHSLRESFRGEVVADMLCYLRLHLELSLRAKGELMMREQGFKTEPDAEVRAKLDELQFLERSIGKTGTLAMRPVLNFRSRDLWQLYMLGK
jgi:RsiW-degrading membrane proteinase PrsW (M82 family)